MEWLILLLAAGVYFAYAILAYGNYFDKKGALFLITAIVIGIFHTLVWYLSVRCIDDKQKFMVFTMLWDFVYIAVFYFVPVFLFGVPMDRWSLIGLVSMVVGLLIMKLKH